MPKPAIMYYSSVDVTDKCSTATYVTQRGRDLHMRAPLGMELRPRERGRRFVWPEHADALAGGIEDFPRSLPARALTLDESVDRIGATAACALRVVALEAGQTDATEVMVGDPAELKTSDWYTAKQACYLPV